MDFATKAVMNGSNLSAIGKVVTKTRAMKREIPGLFTARCNYLTNYLLFFFYINCYLRIQLPLVLVRGGQAEKNIGREKIKKENPLSKKAIRKQIGKKRGGGRANQKRSATIS